MYSDDEVLSYAAKRFPDHKLEILRVSPGFMEGRLVNVVGSKDNPNSSSGYANRIDLYVYQSRSGQIETFRNADEALFYVNDYANNLRQQRPMSRVDVNDLVPAIIAILLTVVICGLVVYQSLQAESVSVPDILGNALTIILGFYFGTYVQQKRGEGVK